MRFLVLLSLLIAVDARAELTPANVKLLAKGKDPRIALRYRPKAGAKHTLVATLRTTENRMTRNGKPEPTELPDPSRVTVDFTVPDASAEQFTCKYNYRKHEILAPEGKLTPKMLEMLKTMDGTTDTVVITNRGVLVDPSIADVRLETLRVTMTQLATAVPEEAVGIGAKWRTTYSLKSGPMEARMEATYELTEFSGTKGKVVVAIKGTGKDPTGGSMTMTGTSTVQFDLTRPVPIDFVYTVRSHYEGTAGSDRLVSDSASTTEMR